MKIIIAENFIRSAKAPTISAGVIIAKVIWNVMNTDSGIAAVILSRVRFCRNILPRLPTNEFILVTPASMPVVSNAIL